jgi:uncharacterized YigZ family protein
MIEQYKTLRQLGIEEIVIKKSRFIGHAQPVESEEEAIRYIDSIKKEHWSATHNCSAYLIGERGECQKQSDDGEPSGTAGKPILEVIKQMGLKNVVVVVTRYFGGIMLGTGGLIRAYTDGAVAAISAAGPVHRVLHSEVSVEIDYTWHGKVENELRSRGLLIGDTQFSDKVNVICLPKASEAESFMEWMTDLTQGKSIITRGADRFIEHEITEH